ncbi:hypothetical protein ACFQT0_01260 [Hymenobacter humi]|uniref:FecR protein domain-containing protein n=1 Tax=Hymenobacter humi TaxID=1411620 RepID=A0ABW2TYL8_9BACT
MATNQSELRALLHRYQLGECTPAEHQRVEEWYSRLGSGQPLELTPAERATLVDTTWQRITDQTKARPPGAPRGQSWAGGRWAAMVILGLGAGVAGFYFGQQPVSPGEPTAKVAPNKHSEWKVLANTSRSEVRVALPDGSVVSLAPASQLKYPRAFAGARRTVYLTGAAF